MPTPLESRFATIKARNLRITGNTYEHKEVIKKAGGMWDNGARVWLAPDEDTQRRMQGLVDGTFSEGFATLPTPILSPPPPGYVGGTHAVAAAKLAELSLRLEALSLALLHANEETALPLAHKIGEVLSDLSRKVK